MQWPVSADALYSIQKFSFGKVYSSFEGNLLYRVSHKKIPCAVLLASFRNFETLICSGGHYENLMT